MSNTQTQNQTSSQEGSFSQTPSEKEALQFVKSQVLENEDQIISDYLLKKLNYLTTAGEDDEESEEDDSEISVEEELKRQLWGVSKIVAVVKTSSHDMWIDGSINLHEYTLPELKIEIYSVDTFSGTLRAVTPSDYSAFYVKVPFDNVGLKHVYNEIQRIYQKWVNLIEIGKKLATQMQNKKDP